MPAEIVLRIEVVERVRYGLHPHFSPEHSHLILQTIVVSQERSISVKLIALRLSVLFLALADFQAQRVHLSLQLRFETKVLFCLLIQSLLKVFDLLLFLLQLVF